MREKTVIIDTALPGPAFSRCREAIRSGGLVVYPTDTFYALGADPNNAVAVKRLFNVKSRQTDQPILLLIQDARDVPRWAAEITPQAEALMKKYWPGPLTLVFKAKPGVLRELTAGTGTIGIRVPGNELTRQLLAYLGTALTGTSANLSGEQSLETAEQAMNAIGPLVDCVFDGGRTAGGKPSTIVDVSTGEPKVIREGAIPSRELFAF
jgi:L-threonylcarbamoyladenylate synthase